MSPGCSRGEQQHMAKQLNGDQSSAANAEAAGKL